MSELCSIVDGEVDDLPETAFYNVGTIDEAREKAEHRDTAHNECGYGKAKTSSGGRDLRSRRK